MPSPTTMPAPPRTRIQTGRWEVTSTCGRQRQRARAMSRHAYPARTLAVRHTRHVVHHTSCCLTVIIHYHYLPDGDWICCTSGGAPVGCACITHPEPVEGCKESRVGRGLAALGMPFPICPFYPSSCTCRYACILHAHVTCRHARACIPALTGLQRHRCLGALIPPKIMDTP